MDRLLQGKTAVVTGCRKGIGLAITECFAKNGANLFACVRKSDENFTKYLSELEQKFEIRAIPIYFDFADENQIGRAAREITNSGQPVHILINNAAIWMASSFQMTSLTAMNDVFRINFFHQMLFTQAISRLIARGGNGSIVNISSSAAIDGNAGCLAYASSKGALITATRVLARELAGKGIRVNAVAPGLTKTDMMLNAAAKEEQTKHLQNSILRRAAEPVEIANICLFLASELSSYITGEVLNANGGS